MLLQVSVTQPLLAERYRLVRLLGQGGMGRVWLARDEVLHRDVAIKEVIPPEGLTAEERDEMRRRTLREARAAARLNHPSVVRVYDVVRTDVHPWIVMEYVPSRSLHEVIAEDGTLSPVRVAQIGLQVLGALRSAHRAGVLHRDVKPSNVLLTDDGRVVLTDFGLATMPGEATVTRPGMVLGSPAYISPERARDGHAGPESDLWSLGATLYAGVEGNSPYQRSSAIATLTALVTEEPPPARHAGPLRPVLAGLLRKNPAARIDAAEAERLLRRAAGGGLASRLWLVPKPRPGAVRQARFTPVPQPQTDQPGGVVGAGTAGRAAGDAAPGQLAGDTAPGQLVGDTAPGQLVGGRAVGDAVAGDTVVVAASAALADTAADATTVVESSGVDATTASGTDATTVIEPAGADATAAAATTVIEPSSTDATAADTPAAQAPAIEAPTADATTVIESSGAEATTIVKAAEPAVAPNAEAEPGDRDSPPDGSAATPADQTAAPAPPRESPAPPPELLALPPELPAPPPESPATGPTPSGPIDGAEKIEHPASARRLRRSAEEYRERAGRVLRSAPRPWVLVAGVVVLALLIVAFIVIPGGGGGSKNAHTPATSSPTGTATSGAPAAPAVPLTPAVSPTGESPVAPPPAGQQPPPAGQPLPDGWQIYHDPTGFSLAVPVGWNTERDGTILYFRDPGGGRVLGIDQSNQPKMDPVADWTNQRNHRVPAGDFPGYREIGIRPVSYFVACADWEFTYDHGGGRTHAVNRGFVTSDHQAYGIWWSTPDSSWQDNLPNFDLITRTFQPKA
jgi:predicted Ser/Thr protein kinase